jgi:hypothetical protein
MTQKQISKFTMASLIAVSIFALAIPATAAPLGTTVQKRGGGGGGGARSGGGGGGQRQAAPPRQSAPVQQVHARREGVRTQNYVGRTQVGGYQQAAPVRQPVPARPTRSSNGGSRVQQTQDRTQPQARSVSSRVQVDRKFTKTAQGRHYDNGLNLRKGTAVKLGWQRRYFPHGYVHFPYYRQFYDRNHCFYSPFGFFFGVCLPFIDISICSVYPPSVVFVDTPSYNGNNAVGYNNLDDQNLIDDPNLDQNEPGLNAALDELTETFQGGNIDGLASLVDPNVSVAVFLSGKYQYSLSSSNYVDLTRDAISALQNPQLNLNYLHQRSPGVFVVSGNQMYTGQNGQTRTVYVSYVLQDISGQWTLTQVGTSPDVIQKY